MILFLWQGHVEYFAIRRLNKLPGMFERTILRQQAAAIVVQFIVARYKK